MTPAEHEKLESLGYKFDDIDFITTPYTKVWRAHASFDSSKNIKEGAPMYYSVKGNTQQEAIENLIEKISKDKE